MRFDRYKLKSGYYFTAFYGKPIMYDVERVPALPLVRSLDRHVREHSEAMADLRRHVLYE